jgi:hypothetical protein
MVFKGVQMNVKNCFDIFNSIKVAKNQFQQPIQYYRDPWATQIGFKIWSGHWH